MAPTPIAPTPIAGSITDTLNASGDTSSCEFADWFTHTQVINGMYKRVFVYETSPTVAVNGVVSGCPQVSYSYVDLNYTVQVAQEKERASYCSGLYIPQKLRIVNDSAVGGLGLSGTFTTSATGYMRRKWILNTDDESMCSMTRNAILGKTPGPYDSSYDTSNSISSHISDLLMHCEEACSTFNQNLVDY